MDRCLALRRELADQSVRIEIAHEERRLKEKHGTIIKTAAEPPYQGRMILAIRGCI
ncbi:MAG: hypothetical protein HGB21_04015 [Nitrospirae bacterium]|nr:hypothetical protein [Nitrospirota bacterium]NTW65470.1 hypothetical protein [Nitrospirota bacterium]